MQELAGIPRSRAGDVIVGRATGQRAIMLVGSEESQDGLIAYHLFVRPGGSGLREHVHPTITERFRVLGGRVGVRIDGEERVLEKGADLTIPPGTRHYWWNAGPGEAQMLVQIDQGRRLELMVCTLFGLGNDRLTTRKGMPRLLQRAVIAREFRDVAEFVRPSRVLQRLVFGVLAPVGQALGYQPFYPRYLRPHGSTAQDPAVLELLDESREVVAA
jgi:mannose-6-phosphate isomerase-like protein (cupin superfamily)